MYVYAYKLVKPSVQKLMTYWYVILAARIYILTSPYTALFIILDYFWLLTYFTGCFE